MIIEPIIHSHITDVLPDDHPKAYESVMCDGCKDEMLHAFNNECMQTWFETGEGNFCSKCFCKLELSVLEDSYGLES